MKDIWDPFEDMRRFRKEMDSLFERFFERPRFKLLGKGEELMVREPLSDVIEKDEEIVAEIELPGVDKRDITVNVTDDYIEIKAEKKHENKIEKKGLHKIERSYSSFYRVLPLPVKVKGEEAEAKFDNGILKIRIPKKEGKKIARRVEIK